MFDKWVSGWATSRNRCGCECAKKCGCGSANVLFFPQPTKKEFLIKNHGITESDEHLQIPTNGSFMDYFQSFIITLEYKKQYGMRQKCKSVVNHLID